MSDDLLDQPIPCDWTAEQAHAVVDFLERLAEVVWSRYGLVISRDCFSHPALPTSPQQLTLPLPPPWCSQDDDILF